MKQDVIAVRGARVNNLKNVNIDIPKNQLVIMTGLSGSGKTSLAFDTIYAEGQETLCRIIKLICKTVLRWNGKT